MVVPGGAASMAFWMRLKNAIGHVPSDGPTTTVSARTGSLPPRIQASNEA